MKPPSLPSITQGQVCCETNRDGVSLTETLHSALLRLPEHTHGRASLSLVLSGSFEERVGDERFHCGPMSLLYKPPGAPHSNRYGPEGARTLLVALDGEIFQRLERVLPAAADRPLRVRGLLAAKALSLFTARREAADSSLDWEELFAEVLDRTMRRFEAEEDRPPWLERIGDLIDSRYAQPLRLSILADEVGVHPVHLARVYRKHHGCSIGDALRRRRVEHAVSRLAPESTELADLALECGFADQSHFTRDFKREVGISPGRFRRRALGLLDGAWDGPPSS